MIHVFPIPIPPPTSLSTRSLWVFPVHQARALVSCIQPGLVISFTRDNIHVSMLFSRNIPPSPSPGAQLSSQSNSHPFMTTGKTIALTRWTFVGKVMSLLFNMLSMLVITFLLRSKRLLISWLQSPSALILEPQKIKSDTVSIVSPSISHEVMVLSVTQILYLCISSYISTLCWD